MPEVIQTVNLDANETVFFARELEHIKTKTYDVVYPELKALSLIPVSTEAGPGAESITYRQYDQLGIAKIISNYADDLPRADVKGKEFTVPVRSLGDSYGYNIQEIRAASMTGKPLEQRRANAARRANDQLVNKIAFFGDATSGLGGLLSNPNIPVVNVPNDGTGSSTKFKDKTPDQILRDLNSVVNGIFSLTNGAETPDTLVLPIDQYTYIASTARSANSDTTILDYFLKNNPLIKKVEWANELKAAGVGAVDMMVAYKRDPDKLTLEIPQPFEQFPVQEKGLEFTVPCHSRCGGVIVYYPLSIAFGEGI